LKRYQSLQILRAIAAWLVVGHHFMQMFYSFKTSTIVGDFFVLRGSFGIDLFFVLSGFVMFLTAKQPSVTAPNFFIKRVIRIAPAYWFFTTVLIAWVVWFPAVYAYTDWNLLSLIKSYLFIPGENPSGIGLLPFLTPGWTLIYEFSFYTTLAICLLFTRKYAVELCFVAVAGMVLFLPDGLTYSPILGSWLMLQFLCGFIIGWYVHSPLYRKINELIPLWLQAGVLLVFAFIMLTGIFTIGVGPRAVAASAIILSGILIDERVEYRSKLAGFLIRCGDYSYSTYLSHVLVIGLFLQIRGGLYARDKSWDNYYLLAIVITTYVVSYLSYRFVEQGAPVKALRSKLLSYTSRVRA